MTYTETRAILLPSSMPYSHVEPQEGIVVVAVPVFPVRVEQLPIVAQLVVVVREEVAVALHAVGDRDPATVGARELGARRGALRLGGGGQERVGGEEGEKEEEEGGEEERGGPGAPEAEGAGRHVFCFEAGSSMGFAFNAGRCGRGRAAEPQLSERRGASILQCSGREMTFYSMHAICHGPA